jgi:hypothetical protein
MEIIFSVTPFQNTFYGKSMKIKRRVTEMFITTLKTKPLLSFVTIFFSLQQ